MSTVTVRSLSKTYPGHPPVPALRDVDLTVEHASIVAVLGPSGCGKSTLLRTIAGFERPDRGEVWFDDAIVSSPSVWVPPERRHVGIVPQEGALFPHLDVGRNVAFGLRHLSSSERRARVAEMLELVGLTGCERRRPEQLSGGQQQRVALARALAPGPAVVLLDEPFTALDTTLRARVREEVVAALAATASTAVLVTHDPVEALAMADTIAVMRAGQIVQTGPPRDVYLRPVDLDTAQLLGEIVTTAGDVHGAEARCVLGLIPVERGDDRTSPATGAARLVFRPEQLVRSHADGTTATVVDVRLHGHDALVQLSVGTEPMLARWPSHDLPAAGDVVHIRFAGAAAVVDAPGA